MHDDIAKAIGIPEWADYDTRIWWHYVNELWLRGRFYAHLEHPFNQEKVGDRFIKTWDRRPSVQLNIPQLTADLTSRKVFAGTHFPRVSHKKEIVQGAFKWLIKEAKVESNMLEIGIWAQGGACAATLKLVKGKPCLSIWKGRVSYPTLDDAGDLSKLMIAYTLPGGEFLKLETAMHTTEDDQDIKPDANYWYVRTWDDTEIITYAPIEENLWNPVDGTPDRLVPALKLEHKMGQIPAVWVTCLPGGDSPDGRSSFHGALDNCVHIDYTLSQMGRGINITASPTLVLKGRTVDYGNKNVLLGPGSAIQLPADVTQGGMTISGNSADYLESSGAGIAVGLEQFTVRMVQWTHELITINRKDPNTIKGVMSGKAMELVDEDFADLYQVLKSKLGDNGLLKILILFGIMLCMQKHPKFHGVSADDCKEIELAYPKLYSASPQEMGFLVKALNDGVNAQFIDRPDAKLYFESQVDLDSAIYNGADTDGKLSATAKNATDVPSGTVDRDKVAGVKTPKKTAKPKVKAGKV